MHSRTRVNILAAIAVMLVGLGWSFVPTATGGGGATVRMRDLQFQPSSVRVKVGQSVTWTNGDEHDHGVNATDNSFKSGNLKPGASFTFRFTKAGSFDYTCPYHPRMRGSVTVEN